MQWLTDVCVTVWSGRHRAFAEVTVVVPSMGDSITEGELGTYMYGVGDAVNMDDVVAEIETDKITTEVKAPCSGTITALLAEEGDTVGTNQDLFTIEEGEGRGGDAAPAAPEPAPAAAAAAPAPAAAAPAPAPAPAPAAAAPAPAPAATPAASGGREERRVPMTRMRKRIAERLKDAQNTAAMLTTFNEIDMSALMAMRSEYKDDFEKKHGVKLGFMSAFICASASGLVEFPDVNAVIDGTDIVYKDYVDISVAVASPKGLVVPVMRNCETYSFADAERTLQGYGLAAREGKLGLEDFAGGNFTISNGGIFGSLFGTPIINPPQSAILGMHGIKERPVVVNGEIVSRPMMYVALTYDHRIVDGREAVGFLKHIKESVEDPRRLILNL